MPADRSGGARKLPSGKWQLRYRDNEGKRHTGGAFPTKSAAMKHYRDVIEPDLDGRATVRGDVTLRELADTFLDRHAKIAKPATIDTLRWRLKRPLEDFGDVRLDELERMTDEIAGFAAKLPDRFRYPVISALRQVCAAGVRYGYMTTNPAKSAGREPDARAAGGSGLHARGARRDRGRNSIREERLRSGSPPRRGYGLRSGRSSNAEMSIALARVSRYAAPRRHARAVRFR